MQPLCAPAAPRGSEAASSLTSFRASTTIIEDLLHHLRPAKIRNRTCRTFLHLVILIVILSTILTYGFAALAPSISRDSKEETDSSLEARVSTAADAGSSEPLRAITGEYGSSYDPPVRAPGLTDQEFNETFQGVPDTLKIGVLLPFTPDSQYPYLSKIARISLSALRMAVRDMNNRKTIPGMNISIVLRDSQQLIPGMNSSGGASAISATTRLLALDIGSVIGDVTSDLTQAEAIMTSSIGVPQCSFASYNKDTSPLANFKYLLRTVPAVFTYYEALSEVIVYYKWKRLSILYTSDTPGMLGEKKFAKLPSMKLIDLVKIVIPLPDTDDGFVAAAKGAIRAIEQSDTRIHILIAPRSSQVILLDLIRNAGLFQKEHVWLASIDVSDSVGGLPNPTDFNGLIMADALWDIPRNRAFETFLSNWVHLDQKEYDDCQLFWIEILVEHAMTLTNGTERDHLLSDIKNGKRSQDLNDAYLGSRSYDTPIGNFTLSKEGDPFHARIAISTFQNNMSVPNGRYIDGNLEIFNPIRFKDGTTDPPLDAPAWDELSPDNDDPFELTMLILSSVLMLAILCTALTVIWNRENIIIKSASVSVINHAVSNKYLLRVIAIPVAVSLLGLSPLLSIHTFPTTLYHVTYYVTTVSIFLVTFMEFSILFIPKLRNLWLQKQGLHVAAGREDSMMDSILGGMSASMGRRGAISNAGQDGFHAGMYDGHTRGEKRLRTVAGDVPGSDQDSVSSVDGHRNPNISDLISTYPFGQINNDNSAMAMEVSPVHRPTNYGSSNLVRRGSKGGHESVIDNLDLPEPSQYPLQTRELTPTSPTSNLGGAHKAGAAHPKTDGYDTFGRDRRTTLRNCGDAQPMDLHEVLKASSNRLNDSGGMLTVNRPRVYHRSSSFNGQDSASPLQDYNDSSVSELDPYSRKSSVGDISMIALGKFRTGVPKSRSPRLYPLQSYGTTAEAGGQGSLASGKRSLRETRMDSYTVTVPVQRQRWYIMRFLAQWRMSRIIFVPYSKVLVIVDLETEKSESLILHSIERGYSPEELQIRPTDRRTSVSTLHNTNNSVERPPLITTSSTSKSVTRFPNSNAAFSPTLVPDHNNVRRNSRDCLTMSRIPSDDGVVSLPSDKSATSSTPAEPSSSTVLGADGQQQQQQQTEELTSHAHRAPLPRFSGVRRMSFHLGLDARNMDGVDEHADEAGADGLEEAVMSDYIIRVISIHNECWRVQLPDQETMDRWIEIGQQIKDENWISRPPNNAAHTLATRKNSVQTVASRSDEWVGVDRFTVHRSVVREDGSRTPFLSQPRPRAVREPLRALHPLQFMNDTFDPVPAPPLQSQPQPPQPPQQQQQQQQQHPDENRSRVNKIPEMSEGSWKESERLKNRQHAAKVNQQLNESLRYAPLRGFISGGGGLGGGGRSRTPAGSSTNGQSPLLRKLMLQRPASATGVMSEKGTHAPVAEIVALSGVVSSRDSSLFGGAVDDRRSKTGQDKEGYDDNADENCVHSATTASSPSGPDVASILDVLAETNIAYDRHQHAVYADSRPGHESRTRRLCNNLQYNYNRRRLAHEESNLFPPSPEWHLTSLELELMEAQRSQQPAESTVEVGGDNSYSGDIVGRMGVITSVGDQVQRMSDLGLTMSSILVDQSLHTFHSSSVPPVAVVETRSRPSSPKVPSGYVESEQQGLQDQHPPQKPLFPPHLARFQSLSPSMMHLPPLGSENNGDDAPGSVPDLDPAKSDLSVDRP
ncbi:hypothetical protein BGX28_003435 [Mortierella sp. GBA30]|nr:hypothetical protein BGX28_003435 [Mortierella sp. GBA30]